MPKIRAAANAAEYEKAVAGMLDALHDPVTYARIGPAQTDPGRRPADGGSTPAGQRTWIHFGLAGSAFASRAGPARVDTATIAMGDGVEAVVRLSEPVSPDTTAPSPSARPDRDYHESRYPSTEFRILAACKIWIVIRDFFAYRDLMDEDWDDVFASFLPKFIAARDAREYNLAVAGMITYISDSNASVESDELSEYFGAAPVGLMLQLIDKKPVIAGVLDPDAKAEVQPGDIVTSVDGEGIIERINREAKYVSSSTQQSLGALVMARLLNGPEGSTAKLTVQDRDGQSRQISLKRTKAYVAMSKTPRSADRIRLLPGNIGYVDLDRLSAEDVDGMFQKLRDTKAIIFDGRGSTHNLGPALARQLSAKTDVAAAIITGPLTLTPDLAINGQLTSTASFFRVEALPPAASAIYKGKTAMLIDERTAGEAEHTGLYLEAANDTAFVGTASAGAEGETGAFVVPGGITVSYSSTDVRHGNAGKLQRLGLPPTENVSPTLAGIRAGRDEVLERAVEYASR